MRASKVIKCDEVRIGAMTEQTSCVFCRIVSRQEPASIVFEDETVVAFLDVMPINPGHTLIVARQHGAHLADLDPADGARMFTVAQRIAAALRAGDIPCQAVNLLLNDGAEAGQRVFHTHLHVIPRVLGDSLARNLDAWMPGREEMDAIAEKLRAGMDGAQP